MKEILRKDGENTLFARIQSLDGADSNFELFYITNFEIQTHELFSNFKFKIRDLKLYKCYVLSSFTWLSRISGFTWR